MKMNILDLFPITIFFAMIMLGIISLYMFFWNTSQPVSAGGGTSFDEVWTSVGTASYQQDAQIANTDNAGEWYCRANWDHSVLGIDTVNGMITIKNGMGGASYWARLENAALSTTKLDPTYPQCMVDMQNNNTIGPVYIKFESGGSDVCHVELDSGDNIEDNLTNTYSYPGSDEFIDRLEYEFEFDFTANTFDLSIGGQSVFTDIAFDNNCNSIDTIEIERWNFGETYIRQVIMGSGVF